MEHTKGPWHVEPDLTGGKPSVRTNSGSVIATMTTTDVNPVTRAHDEANARLIAAAPELLEALERILGESHNPVVERIAQDAIKAAKGDA